MGKTTTIVIDHDRCDPSLWTMRDLRDLENFIKVGGQYHADRMNALGLRVVASEHHTPLGGLLELLGYSKPLKVGDDIGVETSPREVCDYADVDPIGPTRMVKIYQGPVEYAVGVPIGDEDGTIENYEFEFKETEAEALTLAKSILEETRVI